MDGGGHGRSVRLARFLWTVRGQADCLIDDFNDISRPVFIYKRLYIESFISCYIRAYPYISINVCLFSRT